MRPHNYYKTWKDSKVGLQLQAYMKKCNKAGEEARQWAEKQGADSYIESPDGMAGGIAALIFDNCIEKDGYERVVAPSGDVFFLPTEGTELEKEMYGLPVVSEVELIAIFEFKKKVSKSGKPLPFTFGDETPAIYLHHGWWYFDVPYECEAESLTQIEGKEFFRRRMAHINEGG